MDEQINYSTVINSLTEQEQLYWWGIIMGRSINVGQLCCNPHRNDTHPFCRLRVYRNLVLLSDFSFPEYSKYTILHSIRDIRGTSLQEAACCVWYNMYFGKTPILNFNPVKVGATIRGRKSNTEIHFIPHTNKEGKACFVAVDAEYWKKRFVTKIQCENSDRGGRVFSIKTLYLNDVFVPIETRPCFCYTFLSGKLKIYQPYSKKIKWLGSCGKNDYWFTKRESKKLLIGKGQKDHLVAENIFLDFDIFSGMNETTFSTNFKELISEYDEIWSLMDNDAVGVRTSKMLQKEFGIIPKIIDPKSGFKDLDEFVVSCEILPLLINCPIIDNNL